MTKLSPYKIYWIEFIPSKGIVTKHDRKAFGDKMFIGVTKSYRRAFGSKEDAIEYLNNFSHRLDKPYICYIFTDKQFKMAQAPNYDIPYTKKQLAHPYYL